MVTVFLLQTTNFPGLCPVFPSLIMMPVASWFGGIGMAGVSWYKRVQILPGFALIFSSRGISFSFGKRGSSIKVEGPGKWSRGMASGIFDFLKRIFLGGKK